MAESESSDYYKEMSADTFYRWVRERYIPNRPAKSVVNTSNAAYHIIQTDNFYARKNHGILSLVTNAYRECIVTLHKSGLNNVDIMNQVLSEEKVKISRKIIHHFTLLNLRYLQKKSKQLLSLTTEFGSFKLHRHVLERE